MHQFFDPSLLPVVTTDLDGNIMYARTYGLHHYGYPDIISNEADENAEQLLLDILDRIFNLDFNIKSTWNYNGTLFELELRDDGLAHVIYPAVDQVRIVTILNPMTGQPAKHKTKGLTELFNHPEAEIDGDTLYGKEILGYLMDQVKEGMVYDQDTVITYENLLYQMTFSIDRFGDRVIVIELEQDEVASKPKTHIRKGGHLKRIK